VDCFAKNRLAMRFTGGRLVAGDKGKGRALKRGLYAKDFSKLELAGLRQMEADDLRQEIALLRVAIKRMLTLAQSEQDVETVARAVNCVSSAIGALNKTVRTQALLTGTSTPLNEALAGALMDEPFYSDGGEEPAQEPRWKQASLLNC
jgi:hypothetical protein